MPAAIPLSSEEQELVEQCCADLRRVGCGLSAPHAPQPKRSAVGCAKQRLAAAEPASALAMVKISHASPFASWLIVTGRLCVTAHFVVAAGLRLGHAASLYQGPQTVMIDNQRRTSRAYAPAKPAS
jgi:hypothetical protein